MQVPITNSPRDARIFELNTDVLLEIFSACVTQRNLRDTCLDISQAPWTLTQVCQNWRDVVVSSPLLWTLVSVQIDRVHCAESRMPFILELFLSRSSTCRLDINIESRTCIQRTPTFLHPLFSTASRWRSLTVNIPVSSYQSLSPLVGFLDSLEILRIRYPFQDRSQAGHDFGNLASEIKLFGCCTNLKRLSLENLAFPRDLFNLPWAKVQHLDFDSLPCNHPSNKAIIQCLQGMRNITSCILKCRVVAEFPAQKSNHLILPSLHSMTLISGDENAEALDKTGVIQMLSWLTLPSLQHLDLQLRHSRESERSLAEVIQLIYRSGCEINDFALCPFISTTELISPLLRVPSPLQ
ncbi:hypothetical protein GYMLUDRAFT_71343 [Collybiopsis luxurians FD-317 M1]|nr:hypothetical protein GYMLUDRAFT_71343 [Collybiopsis luxurians FD-317 M1]